MKPITQDKGWEERFDKKFTCEVEQISGKISKLVLSDRYGKPVPFISDQLKYFIKSLLKTKGIEVIDECYNIFQRAFLSIKGRIDYDSLPSPCGSSFFLPLMNNGSEWWINIIRGSPFTG